MRDGRTGRDGRAHAGVVTPSCDGRGPEEEGGESTEPGRQPRLEWAGRAARRKNGRDKRRREDSDVAARDCGKIW